jgi:hypothetical protein
MRTFITVLFAWSLIVFVLRTYIIAKAEYPRVVKWSKAEDATFLLFNLGVILFYVWLLWIRGQ